MFACWLVKFTGVSYCVQLYMLGSELVGPLRDECHYPTLAVVVNRKAWFLSYRQRSIQQYQPPAQGSTLPLGGLCQDIKAHLSLWLGRRPARLWFQI